VAVAPIDERAAKRVVLRRHVGVGGALGYTLQAVVSLVGVGSALTELLCELTTVVLAAAEEREGEDGDEENATH
jgi:hypothetical protein